MKQTSALTILYKCDNCDKEWENKESINNCIFCGKEVCLSCASDFVDEDLLSAMIFPELNINRTREKFLCKICYNKVRATLLNIFKEQTRKYFDENRQRDI